VHIDLGFFLLFFLFFFVFFVFWNSNSNKGVAFEQGKMLRVPELVPFRLTRDIEDAMGITGTFHVYHLQNCAKK
jgi:phosphatidylinositol kinase/protein kinase (PI-3  family)